MNVKELKKNTTITSEYSESIIYTDEDINERYNLHVIVPVLWSLIIVFGILGNGIIIYIILRRKLYKNSCTNCYIINVAIADLCFTIICVPFTMSAYVHKEWVFGEFMCHFETLLMFSSVQVSCLTLTAMTIDRYFAILYPLKSLDFRTTKLACTLNCIIWIASFVLNIPYYIYYNQISFNTTTEKSQQITLVHYCIARFPSPNLEIILTMYTVLISYVLPLLTIIFCYARMMIKILKNAKNQLFEEYKFKSNKSIRQDELNLMVTKQPINQTEFENEETITHEQTNRQLQLPQQRNTLSVKTNKNNSNKNGSTQSNTLKAKKQKTKLLFLIATVAITFATTWLPAHVIQIWKIVFNSSFPYSDTMYIIKVISHTLSYSNSLINPFIYVFCGAKFRNHIYLEFNRLCCILCAKYYKESSKHSRSSKAAEYSMKIYQSNIHEQKGIFKSTINNRVTKI